METVGTATILVDRVALIWATTAIVVLALVVLVLVALVYRLLKRINIAQRQNFQTINRYQENAQTKLDALIARVEEMHRGAEDAGRRGPDAKLDVILGKIREYGL